MGKWEAALLFRQVSTFPAGHFSFFFFALFFFLFSVTRLLHKISSSSSISVPLQSLWTAPKGAKGAAKDAWRLACTASVLC